MAVPRASVALPQEAREFYDRAERDYAGFWEQAAIDAADDIHWFCRWDNVFEWEYPTFRWYVGGMTNVSYNCLDHKVERGMGDKVAFISHSGDTGWVRTVTYAELLALVKQCASALRGIGVEKGDRVAIYMPMGEEEASVDEIKQAVRRIRGTDSDGGTRSSLSTD